MIVELYNLSVVKTGSRFILMIEKWSMNSGLRRRREICLCVYTSWAMCLWAKWQKGEDVRRKRCVVKQGVSTVADVHV